MLIVVLILFVSLSILPTIILNKIRTKKFGSIEQVLWIHRRKTKITKNTLKHYKLALEVYFILYINLFWSFYMNFEDIFICTTDTVTGIGGPVNENTLKCIYYLKNRTY